MSSSTSSSNVFRGAAVALAVFAACYVLAWAAYGPFLRLVTSRGFFYDQPESKAAHMERRVEAGSTGFILVGDSTVQYNVDAQRLSNEGLATYNLGVPGANLDQFPTLALEAAKLEPKIVVVVLQTDVPFQRHWGWSGSERLDELAGVWSVGSSLRDRLSVLKQAAIASNRLAVASPVVVDVIARAYAKLQGGPSEVETGPQPGCEPVSVGKKPDRTIVRCATGDGYLLGAGVDSTAPVHEVSLGVADSGKVRFLNKLQSDLVGDGVAMVVVLEPRYRTEFDFDREALAQRLSAPVIDLSRSTIKDDPTLWADAVHMEARGRERFTDLVETALRELPGA